MYQNLKNRVSSLFSKAKTRASNLYAYLAVALVTLSTGSVMAQTSETMSLPNLNAKTIGWADVGQDLVSKVMEPLAVAIAIAVVIWVITMGWQAIRHNVRIGG